MTTSISFRISPRSKTVKPFHRPVFWYFVAVAAAAVGGGGDERPALRDPMDRWVDVVFVVVVVAPGVRRRDELRLKQELTDPLQDFPFRPISIR